MQQIPGIEVSIADGVELITFKRPKKRNALSAEMVIGIPNLLAEADLNAEVHILAITGEGEYFTSGNDLSNFMNANNGSSNDEDNQTMDEKLQYGKNIFHRFVKSFIDFRKPLVAIVNGPTVGIGVTILGLFDLVYASDRATFHCPFTSLGQTPEGCSTLIFPSLMGQSKAAEILIFGKKISAHGARRRNLVSKVVPHKCLKNVYERLKVIAKLPPNTLMNGKRMMRKWNLEELHKVNDGECELLIQQWQTEEFMDAIMTFMSKKASKL